MRTKLDIYCFLPPLGRYLCWWTISPRGYHPPSSPYSWALTWFVRYIYYWNLHNLNNVIIIKIKVVLPQGYVTFLFCLGPLVFLNTKRFIYLVFYLFNFERTRWRSLQKCVVHAKLDICFYYVTIVCLFCIANLVSFIWHRVHFAIVWNRYHVLYGVDHVFCVVSYLSIISEVNIMFCMKKSSCPFVCMWLWTRYHVLYGEIELSFCLSVTLN